MTSTEEKKLQIETLVEEMLEDSHKWMKERLTKVLDSSAIDIEGWQVDNNPMILPKTIVASLLEREAEQYKGFGTRFERQIKKAIKNIRYFI